MVRLSCAYRAVVLLLSAVPGMAAAHSHLWRITEIFSDATGTVQFVEMCECCGSNIEGHLFTDFTFLDTDAKRYFFPSDIGTDPDISANECVLTASQAFADLPGAPTPDYLLDPNLLPFFFDPDADTVTYGREIADYSVIPVPIGAIPTDGVTSLHLDFSGNPSLGVNNPTNFSGETGEINVSTTTVPVLPKAWGAGALILFLAAGAFGARLLRLPRPAG